LKREKKKWIKKILCEVEEEESGDNDELVKQLRENLNFIESQRQYLTRDLDTTRKDNKELEYIREEQVKEINNLRNMLDTIKE
jgi:predicted RNase H-like nuclease (RuvC/YqgF family)